MTAQRQVIAVPAACCALLATISGAASQDAGPEPYKLVRSLQRVQDQIADGDKSALGMQRELTKLIDASFKKLEPDRFTDPQNARALIAYAMAGGNPRTLEAHLTEMGEKDDELVRLAVAVLVYQKGGARTAEAKLRNVATMRIGGLFGASLSLVRGLVTQDDEKARIDFDTARLLAPGTLIEEAALRRLMTIHRRRQDTVSFLRVSSRYARRYIASPYAMQFAQEFVTGVIAMSDTMDMAGVAEVIEFVPEPYRSALTVRLMRTATLEGNTELVRRIAALKPAGDMASEEPPVVDAAINARQNLYSRISEITSENVNEVARELKAIDVSTLSDGDRELLDAVMAIAGAVTDPEPSMTAAIPARHEPARESKFRDAHAPEREAEQNDFDAFVGGTRDTLDNIDKMLEDIQ